MVSVLPAEAVLPADYAERVYAGALGKAIGVYLGRPFEGWSYERIAAELGDITYYVHDKVGVPLIVVDDDITGTFTFVRALPDHGHRADLAPAEIGDTWLNYLIEGRTILWWGGLGRSTEHTAYLRLQQGVRAPASGSAERNGSVVAEQIGAQIFIDGWAMAAAGRPELAADLARRAGTVSHDGEAVHAARLLAAMEAAAFVESDIDTLLDTGLSFVPAESLVARMIADLRAWHRSEPDWRRARELLDRDYGYHRYGGGCHVIPNHGLIILALLYGGGDWDRSMMIVNTCGWDTDCNSGNLGCLLGIRNGLATFDGAHDWRGPVADRMFAPTADVGGAITDVASEAMRIVSIGHRLAGEELVPPKGGARFHFELPGSVHGFTARARQTGTSVSNVAGYSVHGTRSLAVHVAPGTGLVTTPTFLPSTVAQGGYELLAAPTLYPGQTVRAVVTGAEQAVTARLVLGYRCPSSGEIELVDGEPTSLPAGQSRELSWRAPERAGWPVSEVGLRLDTPAAATVHLDLLTWSGEPALALDRTDSDGPLWAYGWVDATDMHDDPAQTTPFDVVSNRGRGLVLSGSRDWHDYGVETTLTPHVGIAAGVAVRVQGLRRYYALLLDQSGAVRLVKHRDGHDHVLAEAALAWVLDRPYALSLSVVGDRLVGRVDGTTLEATDHDHDTLFGDGGVALVAEEGRALFGPVSLRPAG